MDLINAQKMEQIKRLNQPY